MTFLILTCMLQQSLIPRSLQVYCKNLEIKARRPEQQLESARDTRSLCTIPALHTLYQTTLL